MHTVQVSKVGELFVLGIMSRLKFALEKFGYMHALIIII